tara:strand:+ start:373 stop:738 length:366 start_codon:yes stop_codon:yes gene_type:complete
VRVAVTPTRIARSAIWTLPLLSTGRLFACTGPCARTNVVSDSPGVESNACDSPLRIGVDKFHLLEVACWTHWMDAAQPSAIPARFPRRPDTRPPEPRRRSRRLVANGASCAGERTAQAHEL